MTYVLAFIRAHWRACLPYALCIALGLGAGYALWHQPPQPTVTLAQETHAKEQKQTVVDKDATRETQREAGPTRKTVREFAPCPANGQQAVVRETVVESGPVQTVTRAATETHSTEQVQASQDTHLDLTIKPQLPQWQAQVGLEDVLGARQVRLAARRRLFGPVWAEVSGVPAARTVGVALAVEF